MPWSKEHKSGTRERILEAASTAIRGKGPAGVGVAQVMDAAGLTHGGFYAHFGSKEELVANAFELACDQSRRRLEALAERGGKDGALQAVVDGYLSTQHADEPERGCPIAAIGAEVARSEGPVREVLAERVRARLEWMESLSTAPTKEERRLEAAGAYAAMIGGLMLARALEGEERERFLARVRKFVRE